MTENERFTLKNWEDTDWILDNGEVILSKNVVDLLNDFNDENKQLKTDNAQLKAIIKRHALLVDGVLKHE